RLHLGQIARRELRGKRYVIRAAAETSQVAAAARMRMGAASLRCRGMPFSFRGMSFVLMLHLGMKAVHLQGRCRNALKGRREQDARSVKNRDLKPEPPHGLNMHLPVEGRSSPAP